jgi:hypothetical protein
MAGTKIYNIWGDMKRNRIECIVCNEWKDDFNSFYEWAIANGYEEGLVLDRINDDIG